MHDTLTKVWFHHFEQQWIQRSSLWLLWKCEVLTSVFTNMCWSCLSSFVNTVLYQGFCIKSQTMVSENNVNIYLIINLYLPVFSNDDTGTQESHMFAYLHCLQPSPKYLDTSCQNSYRPNPFSRCHSPLTVLLSLFFQSAYPGLSFEVVDGCCTSKPLSSVKT